jgi:hypothetical protein
MIEQQGGSTMNDADKIAAAILASGFCAIKVDRSSVTETIFVDAYERFLQEMAKRGTVAEDADKVNEGMTLQVMRHPAGRPD